MTPGPNVVQSPLTKLTGTMDSNLGDRSTDAYICTFDLIFKHMVYFIFIFCHNISISFNPQIYFQILFYGDKTKYGFFFCLGGGGYRKWLHLNIGNADHKDITQFTTLTYSGHIIICVIQLFLLYVHQRYCLWYQLQLLFVHAKY